MKRLVQQHTQPTLKRFSLQTALKSSSSVPLLKNVQVTTNSVTCTKLNFITKIQPFHTSAPVESQEQQPSGKKPSAEVACRLHTLVRAYRTFGHHEAQLDPLGLQKSKPFVFFVVLIIVSYFFFQPFIGVETKYVFL